MHINPAVASLPTHLKDFIIDQNYNQYTWRNHAVWRYVMKRNFHFLAKVAHESYLEGLEKTGVAYDKIPSLEKMNTILEKIGWGAVCVDGFIPPSAFMEFQAYKVLVIAADIRSIDQLEYTPAPDIIHEAAGHAPIIADPNYAEYLRKFGEIGSKAFSSSYDYEVYEAIRHLSILKADPKCSAKDIQVAEEKIAHLGANPAPPSEMALIRNLHWWTVEYGLIGTVDNPKIYGAGLLSSIGESVLALSDKVTKIPYTLEAMDYSFDITKPQPQLFVTPNFEYLNSVLDEFICTMSYSIGGIHGIKKAIESKNLATAELRSGLQISGIFLSYLSQGSNIVYLQCKGPSQLSYKGKMLNGHGKKHHANGYGTAIGKLKGSHKPMRKLNKTDIKNMGMVAGKSCQLEFDSGLKINAQFISCTRMDDKLLILSFDKCTVTYQNKVLFKPEWGIYDLGIGEYVSSVFSGIVDPEAYEMKLNPPTEVTHKISYSPHEQKIFALYGEVRQLNSKTTYAQAEKLINTVLQIGSQEWLLLIEAYEFVSKISVSLSEKVREVLQSEKYSDSNKKLINLGLEIIDNKP